MTPTPTKFQFLSDEVQESIEAGASVADAARQAGCSPRTVERWLARGRKAAVGPYRDFAGAIDSARETRSLEGIKDFEDAEEFVLAVSSACRAGSVPAMRLYWELLKAHEHPKPGVRDVIGEMKDQRANRELENQLDELAQRREVKGI